MSSESGKDVQPHPPSGEQHEVRHGDQVVVVAEVGATLRAYSAGGLDVLDGFGVDEPSSAGRGQVLAPWPNRLDGGRYEFDGRRGAAAIDEPELGNAIHGLVRWLPWQLASKRDDYVALECVLHPQPAYPWRLELGLQYRLVGDGLEVVALAMNASAEAAPFGIGFHPYPTLGIPVDDVRLTILASRRLTTDDRALPIGEVDLAGTEFDFGVGRSVGATRLDTCFTGLARGSDGRSRARLESAEGGRGVEVWAEEAFGYLQVYTGDTLEPASRRRHAVAIEPMTCPPNAFASGVDVIRLEPGARWSGVWGMAPRQG
ncbi:MAG TPA: aldose 1-epimerase family protein [Actinomycetota bacterium]